MVHSKARMYINLIEAVEAIFIELRFMFRFKIGIGK